MLSLILGNLHVPYRAIDLPERFKELLKSNQGKIDKIFICSTADDPVMQATTSTSLLLEFLHKQVCSNIEIVNSDNPKGIPVSMKHHTKEPFNLSVNGVSDYVKGIKVYKINNFRIAILSQYTIVPKDDVLALISLSRQANSDILVWAGKHEVEAYSLEGVLFISPGSATGAFSIDHMDLDGAESSDDGSENLGDLKSTAIKEKKEEQEEEQEEGRRDSAKISEEYVEKNNQSDKAAGKLTLPTSANTFTEKVNQTNSLAVSETIPTANGANDQVLEKFSNTDSENKATMELGQKLESLDLSKAAANEEVYEGNIQNVPAFIILDIPDNEVEGQDNTCTVYIYSLLGDDEDLKIDKVTFVKNYDC
ncbi:hypothetical protein QEN19_001191 [Hanseniaspora menglaensis]